MDGRIQSSIHVGRNGKPEFPPPLSLSSLPLQQLLRKAVGGS
jgi:hypothetical protein